MNKFLHDPNATLDYRWDFAPWLTVGETISTFTVTAGVGGFTVTTPAPSQASGIVTAWITGGTITAPPTPQPVVCHITTSAGRQDDRTIWLTAINR